MTTKEIEEMATQAPLQSAESDYQTTFRSGVAWGRQVALGDIVADTARLVGILNAGGTVTPEQIKEFHANMEEAYATACERYRLSAHLPS